MTIIQIIGLCLLIILIAVFFSLVNYIFKTFYKIIRKIVSFLLIVGIALRIIVPIFYNKGVIIPITEAQQRNWFVPSWEITYHAIWIPLMLLFLYFVTLNKCPICKSFKFSEINKNKIDQYTENKQSKRYFSGSKGNYVEYYNQDIRVKVYEIICKCNECNNEWSIIEKEIEKGPKKFSKKVKE